MTQTDLEQIIRSVSKTIILDDDEIKYFSSILEAKSYHKKDFILKAGDICQFQNYVVKGCLKIYYTDNIGAEHIIKFANEDWWAVDLQSFATKTPAFYAIQALENTFVFRISRTDYDRLHEAIPKFEKFSKLMFQNSYILLQNRMTQNLSETAEEKYLHFTEKYPGLELRISQKDIAAYLGITPEFLSMLRRKRMQHQFS